MNEVLHLHAVGDSQGGGRGHWQACKVKDFDPKHQVIHPESCLFGLDNKNTLVRKDDHFY